MIQRLFILLLLAFSIAAHSNVKILSISSTQAYVSAPVYSSLKGGRSIYIKVVGHSTRSSQIEVLIDQFPCKIIGEGVSDSGITCQLPEVYASKYYTVTVISRGLSYQTSNPYLIYYHLGYTPTLTAITPTSGVSKTTIYLGGDNKISSFGSNLDNGEIQSIKIGNEECNRYQTDRNPFSAINVQTIRCVQSKSQVAGYYNISKLVTFGYTMNSPLLRISSLNRGEYFQYTVLPAIQEVTSIGNPGGQKLKIKGTGFSKLQSNNIVQVDGNTCNVTKSNEEELLFCILGKRNLSLTSKIPKQVSSQNDLFYSGTGLKYLGYLHQSWSKQDFIKKQQTNVSLLGNPQYTGTKTQLISGDFYASSNIHETWKGFFTAPVSGNYTFRGVSDQYFAMFIAEKYGSLELPSTPFIQAQRNGNLWQGEEDFYYYFNKSGENTTYLEAGKGYYIQVYHVSTSSLSHFNIEVEVPNNDRSLPNQVYEVYQILLNSTNQPEIIVYLMAGGNSSSIITLFIERIDANSGQVTTQATNITYGCSAQAFANALNRFPHFYNYDFTVTSKMLDINGNLTTNRLNTTLFQYEVSIKKLRPDVYINEDFKIEFINFDGTFDWNTISVHSPTINGYWQLSIGNKELNFTYNVQATTIQAQLRKISGFEGVQVRQTVPYVGQQYGTIWLIKFIGFYDNVPNLNINGTQLTGGITNPTLELTQLRNYSSSIIFKVDYRFLSTYSTSPNVLMKVNGIPAVCLKDCSYNFLEVSRITSISINSQNLTISLSRKNNAAFTTQNIKIKVAGHPCQIYQPANNLSVVCKLALGPNKEPILPAGDLIPQVEIDPYGQIDIEDNLPLPSIPLVTSSITIPSGNTPTNNGGILAVISGSGFPQKTEGLIIIICNKKVSIERSTTNSIEFILPKCDSTGNKTITIKYRGKECSNLQIEYFNSSATPTIFYILPTSANPSVKGIIEIWGKDFGANMTDAKVYLTNSTGKAYELKIIFLNNTYIKVGRSGGLAGDFNVLISLTKSGDSVPLTLGADSFSYFVGIDSITPDVGSFNGGTLLRIMGTNFSPASQDTLVFVGSTLNWICQIQFINETLIECKTPPISEDYLPDFPVQVVVATKHLTLSTCNDNCSFTYLNLQDSPQIVSISANRIFTGDVILKGSGFNISQNGSCSINIRNAYTKESIILPTINCSDQTAIFNVKSTISSGLYQVLVRNQIGESNPLYLTVAWYPGVTTGYYYSVEGGVLSFYGGSGFPLALDNSLHYVQLSSDNIKYSLNIVSCCSNNTIKLLIPPLISQRYFKIIFSSKTDSISSLQYQYDFYSMFSNTPKASLISSSAYLFPGNLTINLNRTSTFKSKILSILLSSILNDSLKIETTSVVQNGTFITFNAKLKAGAYKTNILTENGYYQCTDIFNVSAGAIDITSDSLSYAGGTLNIKGANLSEASYLSINNQKAYITQYSQSSITYSIAPITTVQTQSKFGLAQQGLLDMKKIKYFSDQISTNSPAELAFDGLESTVYSSNNKVCWIGMDIGTGLGVVVDKIRYFPSSDWLYTAKYILGATFQGSNDLSQWNNLGTVDQTVHQGYNTLYVNSQIPYRYIRFLHNSTSKCNIAEIQIYGATFGLNSVNLTSQKLNVFYIDGFNNITLTNEIQFREDKTPIVETITPSFGDVFGGYDITLTGLNLGSNNSQILIDGVVCTTKTINSTSVVCIVGARPKIPSSNTFKVFMDERVAIIRAKFQYVLRWSDSRTWGVDLPPIDGDLVYIPPGMSLLVDQSTPILEGIVVENGTIIFSNETDITVQTGFITLRGGELIAGTEWKPYTKLLEFILYGNYYGKQQPIFGNKGIGCLECKLSIYGTPRTPVWTTIAKTILPGDSILTLSEKVDWKIGEEIVIASTSFEHKESQKKTIVEINGTIITVDTPFTYQHLSIVETYGTLDKLTIKAQIGLLTRNIKIRGNPSSFIEKYGGHLKISGKTIDGTAAQVAFTEFSQCGQPQIPDRDCIHFHMNGDMKNSYLRGNAIHESYARLATLQGVNYLTVENNVGYRIPGHNIFLRDGIQMNNLIKDNLIISTISDNYMLQTDFIPASFMITNPKNHLIGNRAAGSDSFGFWLQIKEYSEGSSATGDLCLPGLPLGQFSNNVIHSNGRMGMRLTKFYSRQYSCLPIRNDSNYENPWLFNPSQPSLFSDLLIYRNKECGILAMKTGNNIYKNLTIADHYSISIEFQYADYADQPVKIINSLIIGITKDSLRSSLTNYYIVGIKTPTNGNTNLTNVHFYNFPASSVSLSVCNRCGSDNIGQDVFVKQLQFDTINGSYLQINGLRSIIYDIDASMSSYFDNETRTSATIIRNYAHISQYQTVNCRSPRQLKWTDTIMCNQKAPIKRVVFQNMQFNDWYWYYSIEIKQINNASEYMNMSTPGYKTSLQAVYSLPFVLGQTYAVWWLQMWRYSFTDFTTLTLSASNLFTSQDDGIIFKFIYITNRQFYLVRPKLGGYPLINQDSLTQNINYSNPKTCLNSQFYHNNDNSNMRMLTVCVSGKNRTNNSVTQITAVYCKFLCPKPVDSNDTTFIKQSFVRLWSNASQWPDGRVPLENENVTVNGNWTVLLDIDPSPASYLIIDGDLVTDDTRDVNITATSIYIRAGSITAGSASKPFLHNFTIQINEANNQTYNKTGYNFMESKSLLVTGSLDLYGLNSRTLRAVLTQTALKGARTIFVSSQSGWIVGDELTLSPSFNNPLQFEAVVIGKINPDGSLTLISPLKFTHFGSNSITINHLYGQLDTRTRIGHMSRNIKIMSGPNNQGFSFIVSQTTYGIKRVGVINLSGVQFMNGGLSNSRSMVSFENIGQSKASQIVGSSLFNCKSSCITISNSKKISLTSNNLYNGQGYGAQVSAPKEFTFSDNLIIGVNSACFSTVDYINPSSDAVSITNNYCHGSTGYGFILPHVKCSQTESHTMKYNSAGSCKIGFIFNKIYSECLAFSYISAFSCQIGQISGASPIIALVFSNFIMADNQRAVTLKFGSYEERTNNTAILKNSYISAASRPNCNQCYGSQSNDCTENIGVRMLSVSANGNIVSTNRPFFDEITKQEAFDHKVFIYNVVFDNFNQNYSGLLGSKCSRNFVFRPHPQAYDSVAGHNLFDSQCVNCDKDSYVLCDDNDLSQASWQGGCGDMVCTGKTNYIIQDWNGTFLPFKGVILPNNKNIGMNEPGCTFSTIMNGFICERSDFATLQYESIASDYKSRNMWPVNLTADNSNYTTVTNGFRDWEWRRNQPLNQRYGRFVSIVKLNSTYNMSFKSQPPIEMQFQIQGRTPKGNISNFVIIKLHYPLPNSIRIQVNGLIIKPILVTDSKLSRNLNTSICGDNIYFYNNYTINFVVTEGSNCLVKLTLTQSIQLTTHFAMNTTEFFSKNVHTTFISALCALLNIRDFSRVKIVGVYSGSAIVMTSISPDVVELNSTNVTVSLAQTSSILDTAIKDGSFAKDITAAVGSSVLKASSILAQIQNIVPEQPLTAQTQQFTLGVIIALIVVGFVSSFVLIYVVCKVGKCLREKAKKSGETDIALEQSKVEEKNRESMNQTLGDINAGNTSIPVNIHVNFESITTDGNI